MYVVIFGNFADGINICGPFETEDEAEAYSKDLGWVIKLITPRDKGPVIDQKTGKHEGE